jgi:phosphoribosylaminoimidazole-succinocarboxamide synthase
LHLTHFQPQKIPLFHSTLTLTNRGPRFENRSFTESESTRHSYLQVSTAARRETNSLEQPLAVLALALLSSIQLSTSTAHLKRTFSVPALLKTDLGDSPLLARGKVRDLYAVGDDLLLIATDRISAFDHVLGSGIPGKGKILTQISLFWFQLLSDIAPNHIITSDVRQFPSALQPYADQLEGRSMLVKRAQMFPVECVARGYLAGSGWKEYKASGTVCGIPLPAGLQDGSRLPSPIFTPSTKNQDGAHDENIPYSAVEDLVGPRDAAELRRLTLAMYARAAAHAESHGLILADTKFEFGRTAVGIILADEVLTPDSSRFWQAAAWRPGGAQPSFDKQFVRDYLESIHWNKQAPAPSLPDDVVAKTQAKYLEAFRRLTGQDLQL